MQRHHWLVKITGPKLDVSAIYQTSGDIFAFTIGPNDYDG
jgi:hypothetical protein